jgi:uncharacterized membrane protein YgdD (TMEM256/DUF423 family)
MIRLFMAVGALAGLGAVGMAAYAAHAGLDPARTAALASGVQMQGWHALALLATAIWAERGGWLARLAGFGFIAGLLLFCGAVYASALGGVHMGPVAPTGGTILMLAWAALAASAIRA